MARSMIELDSTAWECGERLPYLDDSHEFEVWIDNYVRTVRRIGDNSLSLTPGTLVFTDCTHPAQNVLCHEPLIKAWRMKGESHEHQ